MGRKNGLADDRVKRTSYNTFDAETRRMMVIVRFGYSDNAFSVYAYVSLTALLLARKKTQKNILSRDAVRYNPS